MSLKLRALFVAALSFAAFAAAASTATAATGVSINAGSFTATTQGLQNMTTTVSGLIPVTISCTQTANFSLTGGLYSGTGLRAIGSLSRVVFACNSTALGTPTISTLATPWTIGGTIARVSGTTALIDVLGVNIQVTLGSTVCLFTGSIGMQVTSGNPRGTLLAVTLTRVSGPCSNGGVSGQFYTFTPGGPTFTELN